MKASQLYMARVQVVEAMEQGLPWHEAAKRAGLPISQSTAYRLRQRMREAGEQALREGRHLLSRATRSKRSLPNSFPFRSV